ncbi:UNVERIFIED_CONTAM: hypothetical protein K2H54_059568, partial [Gekko kuhli]
MVYGRENCASLQDQSRGGGQSRSYPQHQEMTLRIGAGIILPHHQHWWHPVLAGFQQWYWYTWPLSAQPALSYHLGQQQQAPVGIQQQYCRDFSSFVSGLGHRLLPLLVQDP